MRRFLVCNPYGIGDVLFSTPLLRALKAHFPDCVIGYLCNRRTEEILVTHPLIERLFVYEKDELRGQWRKTKWGATRTLWTLGKAIRKERFDTLLDLSLAPEFSLCLGWIGIPRRIGLEYKGRGRFLTDRIFLPGFDDKPVAEYYLELLQAVGVDVAGGRYPTELYTTEEDGAFVEAFFKENRLKQGEVVGIFPSGGATYGAKASYKLWGASRFGRLCDLLSERLGVRTVVFKAPGEEGVTEELLQGTARPPVVLEKTTVRRMASMMKRCSVVVCNDGGPLHVAVSVGVRTVCLFGPTDPAVYGPYPPDPNRHLVLSQPVPCSPCYRRFKLPDCAQNVCLKWISPEKVFQAVERLMKQREEVKR